MRHINTDLTFKELTVLEQLMDGLPSKVVAINLNLDTRTISTHKRSIMHKLGVGTDVELTKKCIRMGLTVL